MGGLTGSARRATLLLVALAMAGALAGPAPAVAADRVLLLDTTITGGSASPEAKRVRELGLEAEIATPEEWGAKSAAEFASYRAVVLGDATCGGSADAAAANTHVWGPRIDGNAILIGTDPTFHDAHGGRKLTDAGIAYAADRPGRTGAYITLSCYHHETAARTRVPLLDGLSAAGDFSVRGVGCYDHAHITAVDSALSGVADADLSGWGCSVHEAFDSYPDDFVVLAIARDIGSTYTAPDGSVGTPYILARGHGTSYVGRSYVALGDSVSAGEGLAWDYRWSSRHDRWERHGPARPAWDVRFTTQRCHQSDGAHPRVAARLLGASLLHLSCTGASARNGVLGERHDERDGWRAPAQLGSAAVGLAPPSARYDEARPDVVSLSLGANDVHFAELVAGCYGFGGFDGGGWGGCNTDPRRLDARLAAQGRDLGLVIDEIGRRPSGGSSGGKAPLVVVTKYADPFPARWSDGCRDLDVPVPGFGLSKREMDFLRGGLDRLNANIEQVARAKGAFVVDPAGAFAAHPFCSSDPWTFGPSIRAPNWHAWVHGPDRSSRAPFHPTAAGQEALGAAVAELVRAKLPVRAGAGVHVAPGAGRLFFSHVTSPGEAAIVPEGPRSPELPPASDFRKTAGFEIVTSASFSGEVQVSLPSEAPQSLFHFTGGRWVEVPSSHADGFVTGAVRSLSPFALGQPVGRVTSRIALPTGGRAPHRVAFDGGASGVAGGGAIVRYEWDFGDGTRASGPRPVHIYRQSGVYAVRLRVTAANGAVDEDRTRVTVTNSAPSAAIASPARAVAGRSVAFDGGRSSDANGAVTGWAWDFGDGTARTSGARARHVFARPGRYLVRVQVTDDEGETGEVVAPVTVVPAGTKLDPRASGQGAGARLRLQSRLRFDPRGRLLVRVGCAPRRGRCRGSVEVRVRRRATTVRLAGGRIDVPAGRSRTLRLRTRRRVLRAVRGRTLALTVRARLAGGHAVSRSVWVRRPRG